MRVVLFRCFVHGESRENQLSPTILLLEFDWLVDEAHIYNWYFPVKLLEYFRKQIKQISADSNKTDSNKTDFLLQFSSVYSSSYILRGSIIIKTL